MNQNEISCVGISKYTLKNEEKVNNSSLTITVTIMKISNGNTLFCIAKFFTQWNIEMIYVPLKMETHDTQNGAVGATNKTRLGKKIDSDCIIFKWDNEKDNDTLHAGHCEQQ